MKLPRRKSIVVRREVLVIDLKLQSIPSQVLVLKQGRALLLPLLDCKDYTDIFKLQREEGRSSPRRDPRVDALHLALNVSH